MADRQWPDRQALAPREAPKVGERCFRPGDRRAVRRVVPREREPGNPRLGQSLLRFGPPCPQRDHTPRGQVLQKRCARGDQPHGIGERERPGGPGGRDLADRMADHGRRTHPPLGKRLDEGHLKRKERRLPDQRTAQRGLVSTEGRARILRRVDPAKLRGDVVIGRAIGRIGGVKLSAHACDLRAVTAEDEGELALPRRADPLDDARALGQAGLRAQRVDSHHGPMREAAAPMGRSGNELRRLRLRGRVEPRPPPIYQGAEGGRACR